MRQRWDGSRLWLPIRTAAGRRMHLAFKTGATPFHGVGFRTRCGRFVPWERSTPIMRTFRYSEVDCRRCVA